MSSDMSNYLISDSETSFPGWWRRYHREIRGKCQDYVYVILSILWYREFWTIQLKYTFETKQERIRVSYHPTHHHGHTNFLVCMFLKKSYFNNLEYSYNIWYVYDKWGMRARTKVAGGNTSSNAQVSALIPRPASNGMESICLCYEST